MPLTEIQLYWMNPFLNVLSVRELREALSKESRKFMIALQHNVSADELQKIRNNIIEISAIIERRERNDMDNKSPEQNTGTPRR